MSLAQIHAEKRRLIILQALDESDFHENEDVLMQLCEEYGFLPSKDLIRADMQFLSDHALIRIEKLPKQSGEMWIAHLLAAGRYVARGGIHPGVARRGLD